MAGAPPSKPRKPPGPCRGLRCAPPAVRSNRRPLRRAGALRTGDTGPGGPASGGRGGLGAMWSWTSYSTATPSHLDVPRRGQARHADVGHARGDHLLQDGGARCRHPVLAADAGEIGARGSVVCAGDWRGRGRAGCEEDGEEQAFQDCTLSDTQTPRSCFRSAEALECSLVR